MNSLNNKQNILSEGNGIRLISDENTKRTTISSTLWNEATNICFNTNDNIGIGITNTSSKLHVVGDIKFSGKIYHNDTDVFATKSDINHTHIFNHITDLNTTDDLPEGNTSLYFSPTKVNNIVNASNLYTSNYINNINNDFDNIISISLSSSAWASNYVNDFIYYNNVQIYSNIIKIDNHGKKETLINTTDEITQVFNNTSNYIEGVYNNFETHISTDYYTKTRIDNEIINLSNLILTSSNLSQQYTQTMIDTKFVNTSNYAKVLYDNINNNKDNMYYKTESDLFFTNTSNYISNSVESPNTKINNINTSDDLQEGNKKFINELNTENIFNTSIILNGDFTTSNLLINGYTTDLNTQSFSTDKLVILSDTNGPVLDVTQLSLGNIFEAYSNMSNVFTIDNNGNVGINKSVPLFALDVNGDININGSINASSFIGDGSGLTNINVNVNNITGILPVSKGGTGLDISYLNRSGYLVGNGTNTMQVSNMSINYIYNYATDTLIDYDVNIWYLYCQKMIIENTGIIKHQGHNISLFKNSLNHNNENYAFSILTPTNTSLVEDFNITLLPYFGGSYMFNIRIKNSTTTIGTFYKCEAYNLDLENTATYSYGYIDLEILALNSIRVIDANGTSTIFYLTNSISLGGSINKTIIGANIITLGGTKIYVDKHGSVYHQCTTGTNSIVSFHRI